MHKNIAFRYINIWKMCQKQVRQKVYKNYIWNIQTQLGRRSLRKVAHFLLSWRVNPQRKSTSLKLTPLDDKYMASC